MTHRSVCFALRVGQQQLLREARLGGELLTPLRRPDADQQQLGACALELGQNLARELCRQLPARCVEIT